MSYHIIDHIFTPQLSNYAELAKNHKVLLHRLVISISKTMDGSLSASHRFLIHNVNNQWAFKCAESKFRSFEFLCCLCVQIYLVNKMFEIPKLSQKRGLSSLK